jgi:cytochrome b involved in lipid metabolism
MRAILLIAGLVILAGCADIDAPSEVPSSPPDQTGQETIPPADTPGSVYMMADVEARNSEAECWTVIRGEVYDLTAWIREHPGGARGILSLCGTDGTQAFERQHGGRTGPESTLDGYVIGSLG